MLCSWFFCQIGNGLLLANGALPCQATHGQHLAVVQMFALFLCGGSVVADS